MAERIRRLLDFIVFTLGEIRPTSRLRFNIEQISRFLGDFLDDTPPAPKWWHVRARIRFRTRMRSFVRRVAVYILVFDESVTHIRPGESHGPLLRGAIHDILRFRLDRLIPNFLGEVSEELDAAIASRDANELGLLLIRAAGLKPNLIDRMVGILDRLIQMATSAMRSMKESIGL